MTLDCYKGFPCNSAGKESACNVGDLGSVPWVGKIPWRRERLPTPVFWPGEFHGLYSPWGHMDYKSDQKYFIVTWTINVAQYEQLSLSLTGIGYSVLLRSANITFCFTNWRCGNPESRKSIRAILPTFAHFLSLCRILAILTVFQTFSSLLSLLWWFVTSDPWCYCCGCLGGSMNCAHVKTGS